MPTGIYDRTKSKPNMGEFGKRPAWNKGKRGIYSSAMIKKLSIACKKLNPAFKGGRIKRNGYIFILSPDHPHAGHSGYVREHRLVVEKQIGRYLLPKEQVHHLDETDNNLPDKLMAFISDGAHKRFEHNLPVKPEEIIYDGRELQCV